MNEPPSPAASLDARRPAEAPPAPAAPATGSPAADAPQAPASAESILDSMRRNILNGPEAIKEQIVAALQKVYDPEIPVNIYEMGLIYDIALEPDGKAKIKMTLTAPSCPSAQMLPVEVKGAAKSVPGVTDAEVEVVWDPPWKPDKMSDAAKLQLGLI
jgi:FeS assembly SUF system protein